jgi:hypothetical protein
MLRRTMNQLIGNINIRQFYPGNFRKSSDLKENKIEEFPLRGRQANYKLSLLTPIDKKGSQAKKVSKSQSKIKFNIN